VSGKAYAVGTDTVILISAIVFLRILRAGGATVVLGFGRGPFRRRTHYGSFTMGSHRGHTKRGRLALAVFCGRRCRRRDLDDDALALAGSQLDQSRYYSRFLRIAGGYPRVVRVVALASA
jgi:hypothetical protein